MQTAQPPAEPLSAPVAPLSAAERLPVVDMLRGAALLGILVENILFFSGPRELWQLLPPLWPGAVDRAYNFGVLWLEQGKVYSLFAGLFGFGIAMQMQRAGTGGFMVLYLRRLVVLLGIGLVHGLFIWWGDILFQYAILGFCLLPFRRVKDRPLLIAAGVLWLTPVLCAAGLAALSEVARRLGVDARTAGGQAVLLQAAQESLRVYGHGTWLEIQGLRMREFLAAQGEVVMLLPGMLMMFLLGLYAGRRGLLHAPVEHAALWRRLLVWGLPSGLVVHLAYAVVATSIDVTQPGLLAGSTFILYALGLPPLALGYIAGLIVLLQRATWQRVLRPLAALGEMSLTNYLLQSVVCTLLFYSYGLGWFGRMGPALSLVPTLALFALQVVLSNWWLKRFRFGPLEWAWRAVTYGKAPPMRRTA